MNLCTIPEQGAWDSNMTKDAGLPTRGLPSELKLHLKLLRSVDESVTAAFEARQAALATG